MNPLIQGHSGITPEMSRNAISTNRGTNQDDSQSDPHPEAGIFSNQMTQNSGPKDDRDMVTGATEQIRNRHDMVTEATEQIRNRHNIVTGVHEEITYCSPSTSSGSRKRTALQVNHNSAVKTPLRRLRQTKFSWRFNSWQTTTILQISVTILTEFRNCQSHLRQRCLRSTGTLKFRAV